MASTINSNTSSGVVVTSDTSGVLQLQTAGTTAVTINASQQVGIGTSSPTTNLQIGDASVSSANKITLGKTTSTTEATLPTVYAGSLIVPAASVDLVLEAGSSSGGIAIRTAGSTRAVVDSVGNLGIGTSSPVGKLQLSQTNNTTINGGAYINLGKTENGVGGYHLIGMGYNANSNYAPAYMGYVETANNAGTAGDLVYFTRPSGNADTVAPTERARIDSSGNLLVGTTSTSNTALGFRVTNPSSSTPQVSVGVSAASNNYVLYNTTAAAFRFYVSDAGQINATSTSISAISDATLKTNVRDIETGLNQIMALKPRRFDWINGDGENIAGFISQEVEQVLPDLVSESIYSCDDEGNEIHKKFLKMGDMIPTIVKAIQELSAQVTELKAEVALLKGV